MTELITTKQEVCSLLEKIPETRDNDMILYYEYCINHFIRETEMYKVFKDSNFRNTKGVSPFETVSRVRRELQNDFINLRSDERIKKAREAREEVFNNYYGRK